MANKYPSWQDSIIETVRQNFSNMTLDIGAISKAIPKAETKRAMNEPERSSSWGYARDIVQGVIENRPEIDELIETYSQGWTLSRMPTIDRAILRIGIWELTHNAEIPQAVAISEAVELAQSLSTDDSASFVNGLLARIASTITA